MKGGGFAWLSFWPALQRELREGARRPANHRLRVGTALGGTILLWAISISLNAPAARVGTWLFAGTHTLVLAFLVLTTPAMAGDCVAREKREGTLGLLFLTPLNSAGIIVAKALAVGLRTVTIWLAALPLLTIPFMTGGVTLMDMGSAVSIEFCTIAICLAAGLAATSMAKERNTALVLAYLLAVGGMLVFSEAMLLLLTGFWRGFSGMGAGDWRQLIVVAPALLGGLFNFQGRGGWSPLGNQSAKLGTIWQWLCGLSPAVALIVLGGALTLAIWLLEKAWRDEIPSARREKLKRVYCTPLFFGRFTRVMKAKRGRNPVAWLQQRSWKSGTWAWGLCFVFLVVECVGGGANGVELGLWQTVLGLALAGIYTFAGVSSFLEEKRSGALELLLVTPLSVNKLIWGRVQGLWMQFLPSGALLGGVVLFQTWYEAPGLVGGGWGAPAWRTLAYYNPFVRALWMPLLIYLTLPVFATYFALRVKNLTAGAALTWLSLGAVAWLAISLQQQFRIEWVGSPPISLLIFGAFAGLACFLLRHSLSRRIYAF